MSNRTGIWIKAALLLLAGAWQCDALAAPGAPAARDVEQITVHFGDLNIDQTAGTPVLYPGIRNPPKSRSGRPHLPPPRAVSPPCCGPLSPPPTTARSLAEAPA